MDPNAVETPQFAADLERLRRRQSVRLPQDHGSVEPADFVILEEPFGRSRDVMAPMIDLAVHIAIPHDVAMARRLLRTVGLRPQMGDPGLIDELEEQLRAFLAGGRDIYLALDIQAQARRGPRPGRTAAGRGAGRRSHGGDSRPLVAASAPSAFQHQGVLRNGHGYEIASISTRRGRRRRRHRQRRGAPVRPIRPGRGPGRQPGRPARPGQEVDREERPALRLPAKGSGKAVGRRCPNPVFGRDRSPCGRRVRDREHHRELGPEASGT